MKAAGFEPVALQSGYNGNELGAYIELRDNRVALFVRSLARGKHSVSYRMRAEIPGRFSALPTKASAMYAPELRGNSDELKLNIDDATRRRTTESAQQSGRANSRREPSRNRSSRIDDSRQQSSGRARIALDIAFRLASPAERIRRVRRR